METVARSALKRFEELTARTYKKVYNLAFRLVGNSTDAEDLTQEAYYRAFRSFEKFQGDRPFENWILRIVTRLFLDLLRHRRRRVHAVSYDAPLQKDANEDDLFFEKPDNSTNPEHMVMESTLSEELEQALCRLTPEQRTVVELADLQQLPYKDVAEMMNAPVGTIRSRLHRSHRAMARHMRQWEERNKEHAANLKLCEV